MHLSDPFANAPPRPVPVTHALARDVEFLSDIGLGDAHGEEPGRMLRRTYGPLKSRWGARVVIMPIYPTDGE